MSSSRYPVHDLRLERLGDRDGWRRGHLDEAAQVRLLERPASSVERFSAAYQALIDAVFTAPGATEWLNGLRQRMADLLAGQKGSRQHAVPCDAIRAADPGLGRF